MIGWITDNNISKIVMDATGLEVKHIGRFHNNVPTRGVFYGIMRGTGRAMHILKFHDVDYWYIDNGYFEARYINKDKLKDMGGKYRVVKNDMIEPYRGVRKNIKKSGKRVLVIRPSIYTANHYDTTPEEWSAPYESALLEKGFEGKVRTKDSSESLEEDLSSHDMVLSMNSMSCMKAIEMGIPCYDSHGIFRNANDIFGDFRPQLVAEIEDLRAYYEPKQFTLEELKEKAPWNTESI